MQSFLRDAVHSPMRTLFLSPAIGLRICTRKAGARGGVEAGKVCGQQGGAEGVGVGGEFEI